MIRNLSLTLEDIDETVKMASLLLPQSIKFLDGLAIVFDYLLTSEQGGVCVVTNIT